MNNDWLALARKHGYAFPDARLEAFVSELQTHTLQEAAAACRRVAHSDTDRDTSYYQAVEACTQAVTKLHHR